MGKYILTNKAVDDLSFIWNYTLEEWPEKQADKYYSMLLSFCQDLADGKVAGKNYQEAEDELLGLRAGKHIIFYKKTDARQVLIVRILHGRMDYKNRLLE